jgi:hypothetical protein
LSNFRSDDHDPEGCQGCRPVVFDPKTGKIERQVTAVAGEIFDAASPDARKAFHRVTCLNSRDPIDITLAKTITKALEMRFLQ